MQRTKELKHALTETDIDFICRITEKYSKQHELREPEKASRHRYNNSYLYQNFASDLKHIFVYPDVATIWEVGDLMTEMTNSDRMHLLKLRPSLVKNCEDLAFLLKKFIPNNDRLLLAIAQADKIMDKKKMVRENNLALILHTLPITDQSNFEHFVKVKLFAPADQHMYHIREALMEMPAHGISFSLSFIFGSVGALSHLTQIFTSIESAAFLLAAATAAHGLYELYHEPHLKPKLTYNDLRPA
jgi:hypothetical protein